MATKPNFHGEILLADSSVIRAVKYDPSLNVLDVKLTSGKAYRYRQVGSWDFTQLVTGKSAGKVYNETIKLTNYGAKRRASRLRTW